MGEYCVSTPHVKPIKSSAGYVCDVVSPLKEAVCSSGRQRRSLRPITFQVLMISWCTQQTVLSIDELQKKAGIRRTVEKLSVSASYGPLLASLFLWSFGRSRSLWFWLEMSCHMQLFSWRIFDEICDYRSSETPTGLRSEEIPSVITGCLLHIVTTLGCWNSNRSYIVLFP